MVSLPNSAASPAASYSVLLTFTYFLHEKVEIILSNPGSIPGGLSGTEAVRTHRRIVQCGGLQYITLRNCFTFAYIISNRSTF